MSQMTPAPPAVPNGSTAVRRTFAEIMDDLKKPIPERLIKTKTVPTRKGSYTADYIHHATVRDLLDHYAPGWESRLRIQEANGKVYVICSLTIHAADQSVTREGAGNEEADYDAFGDPSSNAHAQALRRAAMEFGLARELWRK